MKAVNAILNTDGSKYLFACNLQIQIVSAADELFLGKVLYNLR